MDIGKRDIVSATLGQVERDIIRTHVLGNFSDMLLGILEHPAMVAYLDNTLSIGPRSEEALSGYPIGTGLNENLAREVMELHTMGARPGAREPQQADLLPGDVTNFARALTGWSMFADGTPIRTRTADPTQIVASSSTGRDWHEPGSFEIMGKRYRPSLRDGMKQARDAILDFARHPATAQHLAFKLVRHFITDQPTAEIIMPLAQTFTSTGGDLMQVSLALLDLAAAWSLGLTKICQPYELLSLSFGRLADAFRPRRNTVHFNGMIARWSMRFGRLPRRPDIRTISDLWLTPEAMANRIDTIGMDARTSAPRSRMCSGLPGPCTGKALSLDTGQRLIGSAACPHLPHDPLRKP